MAKKPLLASLDPVFYDKVLTPLRLDVELAKVDLEDIYDAHALEEARDSLRQLKQAAGGAGDAQHFPMMHFDSAATVENDAVKGDNVGIAESDTSEHDMPFPKQFPDIEPPFVDNMSLGFHDESEVSMHSFAPETSLIPPTNDFSVDVINLESDSESDIEDEAMAVSGMTCHRPLHGSAV
ncbi:hypothetical protein CYMTET_26139 [Cymbomonas tetramitiformis]|uniref:Uncharacterized protein n=1 Tax=Cymbomonas tetramitiformis TaxID=36881 RepID=A0AAE0FSD9_9CHLO|nr:hypothetical protein CYMTET_26139 [Cymbomonas tetramitiformis]